MATAKEKIMLALIAGGYYGKGPIDATTAKGCAGPIEELAHDVDRIRQHSGCIDDDVEPDVHYGRLGSDRRE